MKVISDKNENLFLTWEIPDRKLDEGAVRNIIFLNLFHTNKMRLYKTTFKITGLK